MRTNGLLAAAFVVLTAVACTSNDRDREATSPPTTSSEVPAVSAAGPSATPWVPPPPVTNRLNEPRGAPGTDYPSVGLRSDGIPLAAAGTLVVYAKELRGSANIEVVVFDLETATRLSTFPLNSNDRSSVQLAGNRVLVSFGKQLWSYALDGSGGRVLNDELHVSYMLPSPDGRHVAVTGFEEGFGASVALIDIVSGELVQHVDLANQVREWRGEPHPTRWLSNSEVLIGGLCNCDVVQEENFIASVSLDGTVAQLLDPPAPTAVATVEIVDAFDPGCLLVGFAGGRTARLVRNASGAILAAVSDQAPIFLGGTASPDGTEALVLSLDADDALRARLNAVLESGNCDDGTDSGWGSAPRALGLRRDRTDALEAVASPLEVFERWYGERLPVYTCNAEERAGADTSQWLDPAPWRSPAGFGEPWGFTSEECQRGRVSVDMRVGPVAVDTDAEGYRVLGFLEAG